MPRAQAFDFDPHCLHRPDPAAVLGCGRSGSRSAGRACRAGRTGDGGAAGRARRDAPGLRRRRHGGAASCRRSARPGPASSLARSLLALSAGSAQVAAQAEREGATRSHAVLAASDPSPLAVLADAALAACPHRPLSLTVYRPRRQRRARAAASTRRGIAERHRRRRRIALPAADLPAKAAAAASSRRCGRRRRRAGCSSCAVPASSCGRFARCPG